ncbi:hypothetical protein Pla175_03490 [Pirellulimonas nuda]|uniref:RanBP2-type domain-containing protein n=2 Tax=Pirellulimonas nuda TaxID=2528009 RepID=A0A518D6A0_9BACT|nr:hypothetical protein Pla175_03490 [Pirellulimonas nuda]
MEAPQPVPPQAVPPQPEPLPAAADPFAGLAPPDDAAAPRDASREPWTCPTCGELSEFGFEACWNCGTTADGVECPDFVKEWEPQPEDAPDQPAATSGEPSQEPWRGQAEPSVASVAQRVIDCPDCRSPTRAIVLIDNSGESQRHEQLRYAAPGAERGWFFGQYAETGQVSAKMCPKCGRITLYGEPGQPT